MRFLKFPRDPAGSRGNFRNRKKPWAFAPRPRRSPQRDRRGRGAKTRGFLRFLKFPRDPLRGSAWSRCKSPWFSAFSARATLCGNRRGRGAKPQGFLQLLLFELVLGSCLVVRAPAPGTGGSRVRFLPGPRAGVARCNLHFKATCAEQVAQSNLRRPTCTDQCSQSALPRATCAEQLTQSNLHRATCTEQLAQSNLQGAQFAQSNLQGATCRGQLAGATCAEQLAQSNLHSATCVEQFAQTNLHRPVCAEHLAWCCPALASQMLRGGKKNASCSVGPTSLAMLCFRANRGLVFPTVLSRRFAEIQKQHHAVATRWSFLKVC